MPTTTSSPPKAQPWKAHWSPMNKASETRGPKYLVDGSNTLLVDGVIIYVSGDRISELACARKDVEAPKVQPWKTHWSTTNKAPNEGHKYLVDGSGTLLVDGVHNCASADLFSELASARKEPEAPKAQPWKTHWSTTNKAPNKGHKYLVDGSGTLLVDGGHTCASADLFSELSCARKEEKQK
ncbi:MAG: hypothetical protein Q9224_004920 [Gallowayella concinna]